MFQNSIYTSIFEIIGSYITAISWSRSRLLKSSPFNWHNRLNEIYVRCNADRKFIIMFQDFFAYLVISYQISRKSRHSSSYLISIVSQSRENLRTYARADIDRRYQQRDRDTAAIKCVPNGRFAKENEINKESGRCKIEWALSREPQGERTAFCLCRRFKRRKSGVQAWQRAAALDKERRNEAGWWRKKKEKGVVGVDRYLLDRRSQKQ